MMRIGITGGTGAGKTSALRALRRLGAKTIDCDAVYHELLIRNEQMKKEIGERFSGVLRGGEVDREALGAEVFTKKGALEDLNKITHKYVKEETEKRTEEWKREGVRVTAYDAIALIESGMAEECCVVIGIIAPVELRIERIMRRDGITEEKARRRIAAQKPDGYFEKNCDYIIKNEEKTAEEFEERCINYFTGIIGRKRDGKEGTNL